MENQNIENLIYEEIRKYGEDFKKNSGTCEYPFGCGNLKAKNHTISKNKHLKEISDGNNEVYTFSPDTFSLNQLHKMILCSWSSI